MNNFVITDVTNRFFVINKIVRDSYFNFWNNSSEIFVEFLFEFLFCVTFAVHILTFCLGILLILKDILG